MMMDEHPQKAGPLAGRQLRYLIGSRHGLLGGFAFAASALQLADRDQWIGWDAEIRQRYLHYVVGMSRFLIRPCVQCRNLASKALGMIMADMPDDFERRYGSCARVPFGRVGRRSAVAHLGRSWRLHRQESRC